MSNYESVQRRRNIIVGLFVLLGLCSLFWMVFKFGDLPVVVSKWKSFEVTVQLPKAVGVQEKTTVQFCGYQIGSVTHVRPPEILEDLKAGKFYHQTAVVISIDKKYDDIPDDVEVKLMTRGLGSSYIEFNVLPPDGNQPTTEFLKEGSVLQGSVGVSSEFFPEESQKKLDKLADGLITLIDSANDIFGDSTNKENIKTALANLSEASRQATQTLKKIQEFSSAGTNTSEELGKALVQFQVILEKVNNGQGTIAKLVNDGRLYENLLENSQQIQVLLLEMKAFVDQSRNDGLPIKLK